MEELKFEDLVCPRFDMDQIVGVLVGGSYGKVRLENYAIEDIHYSSKRKDFTYYLRDLTTGVSLDRGYKEDELFGSPEDVREWASKNWVSESWL